MNRIEEREVKKELFKTEINSNNYITVNWQKYKKV